MDELLAQLTAYARAIWHRRWIGIAAAWLVALVGATIVMQMPDRYEATARVYVDTQSVLRPLLSGLAVQPNIDQQLAILSRTLVSRPNLERLLRMSDMDLQAKSAAQKEELIEKLQKSVKISSAAAATSVTTRTCTRSATRILGPRRPSASCSRCSRSSSSRASATSARTPTPRAGSSRSRSSSTRSASRRRRTG